jgi:hypothetical protein
MVQTCAASPVGVGSPLLVEKVKIPEQARIWEVEWMLKKRRLSSFATDCTNMHHRVFNVEFKPGAAGDQSLPPFGVAGRRGVSASGLGVALERMGALECSSKFEDLYAILRGK